MISLDYLINVEEVDDLIESGVEVVQQVNHLWNVQHFMMEVKK